MQAGDRVRWEGELGPMLGTVTKVSPMGYVVIQFDDASTTHYSPARAAAALTVVTGDDALHRHAWHQEQDICTRCLVRWAPERMDEPCYQLHPDGVR